MIIKDLKETFKAMFSPAHNVSALQMSLTVLQVMALVLSNIMVVKSFNLFGLPFFAQTCALITFPITYTLSDVFSEVYGYRWSRVSGTWAVIGTALASILFTIAIAIKGNASWTNQEALVAILGNSPKIAFASVLAFWVGDVIDDKTFDAIKRKSANEKTFAIRAIVSSLVGKYADQIVFTFIGLSFLPLQTKLYMIASAPIAHLMCETVLLPVTHAIARKLKKLEGI